MALKEETRTIDGEQYQFTQLPFTPSRRLWLRVLKAVGPSFAQAFSSVGSLREMMDQEFDVGGALAQLVYSINEDDLDYITQELAQNCRVKMGDGSWPKLADQLETHFSGPLTHWLKWMKAGLEVNYADFFDVLKSASSAIAQPSSEASGDSGS